MPRTVSEYDQLLKMEQDGHFHVLYNISHYGYFLEVILHSIKNHPDSDTVLMIDESWLSPETTEFIHGIDCIPGFCHFILYNESKFRKKSDITVEMIISYFDKLLMDNNHSINDFDIVYSGFDTIHAFGIYLNHKGKHYQLFDGNLVASVNESEPLFEKSPYHKLLKKYHALTWNSPFVDGVIYTLGNSEEDIKNKLKLGNHPYKNRSIAVGKEVRYFDKITYLNSMEQSLLNQLLVFFKIPDFHCKDIDILLLTSSFFTHSGKYIHDSSLTPFEEYIFPFLVLIDTQFDGLNEIIIKPHPNNEIPLLSRNYYLSDYTYIPGFVPSELLSHCGAHYSKGVSPGSNSILTFSLDNVVTFPRSFFYNLDKYLYLYIFQDIASKLKIDTIVFYNSDSNFVDSLDVISDIHIDSSFSKDDVKSIIYFDSVEEYESHIGELSGIVIIPFSEKYAFDGDSIIMSIEGVAENSVNIPSFVNKCVIIKAASRIRNFFVHYFFIKSFKQSNFNLLFHNISFKNYVLDTIRSNLIVNESIDSYLSRCITMHSNKELTSDSLINIMKCFIYNPLISNKYRHTYFSLLWKRSDPNDDKELIHIISYMYCTKDNYAYRYHAWLYKQGKIVHQDYNMAAILLRKAVAKNIPRSIYELCSTLLLINTDESLSECKILLNKLDLSSDERAIKIKSILDSKFDN